VKKKKDKAAKAETVAIDSVESSTKTKKDNILKIKDTTFLKAALILCFAAILSALAAGGFWFWKIQEKIIIESKIQKNNTLEIYSKLINTQIDLIQKDVNYTSNLIKSSNNLYAMDEAQLIALKKIAQDNLPGSIGIQIFFLGQYELNKNQYPPINFSTQKQLLSAENENYTLPDFYKDPKGNYFNLVRAIKNPENNEILVSLLVSYPEDLILKHLPKNNLDNTQVSLVQIFGKDDEQVIFSSGKTTGGKNIELRDTLHPNWKIQYQSNQEENLYSQAAMSFLISVGLSVLVMLCAIFICISLLRRSLTTDASLIFEFIRSSNQKAISESIFKTGLFRDLYIQIKNLDIQPSVTKKRGLSSRSETNNFDINIASGDENLFGGEHELSTESASAKKENQSLKINPAIFRAYDIRGIVGETLTPQIVKLIGQAIGSEVLKLGERSVIVARDGRLSGPELSEALCQGILSSGANVVDIGMVPTPVLYFACKTLEARSGVMLTGSHNPRNHNGLKIVINGVTLATEAIQKLRENIESKNLSQGEGQLSTEDLLPAYVDVIENDVILAQPLNIVIDCGNGVAGVIAEKLFTQLGCNVTMLYGNVDGNFPNHHPDPSRPDNLKDLIAKVKETGAHLGIAFDGDGDRLGIVTNKGKIIWPDRLMMLFSKDILQRSPGADIIFDVKCSNTLAETIRKQGGRPLMWKTGHSLIKAKLAESGAQLAGEMSGHIFFNDRWYGFDDGLYSAARLLEILSTTSKSCDEIFAEFPEMVSTPEINIAVDDEGKFDIVSVLASLGDFGEGNKTDIDGIRIDYADGWGLVRASNTSANLVTRFEAKTDARLAQIQAVFKAQILKVQGDLDIPF